MMERVMYKGSIVFRSGSHLRFTGTAELLM